MSADDRGGAPAAAPSSVGRAVRILAPIAVALSLAGLALCVWFFVSLVVLYFSKPTWPAIPLPPPLPPVEPALYGLPLCAVGTVMAGVLAAWSKRRAASSRCATLGVYLGGGGLFTCAVPVVIFTALYIVFPPMYDWGIGLVLAVVWTVGLAVLLLHALRRTAAVQGIVAFMSRHRLIIIVAVPLVLTAAYVLAALFGPD